jgi:uncharacterized protein YhhL (DUF1145 family)
MSGQDPVATSQTSIGAVQPDPTPEGALSISNDKIPPRLPQHMQVQYGQAIDKPAQRNSWSNVFYSIYEMTSGKSHTYGAPRVFDLFTMLAITLAFAFLFALLNLLSPALGVSAEGLVLAIGALVAIVGAAQMVLFNSKNPRLASFIAGPPALFAVICYPVYQVINDDLIGGIFYAGMLSALFGILAGYLAGGVVAGVFLLADRFRNYYFKPPVAQRDSGFDEVQ